MRFFIDCYFPHQDFLSWYLLYREVNAMSGSEMAVVSASLDRIFAQKATAIVKAAAMDTV